MNILLGPHRLCYHSVYKFDTISTMMLHSKYWNIYICLPPYPSAIRLPVLLPDNPHQGDTFYQPPRKALGSSVGFNTGNLDQYPVPHHRETALFVPEITSSHKSSLLMSFPHSWLIIGFVPILTRRVSLVEQELLTLPEHLSSPPFGSGFVLLDL